CPRKQYVTAAERAELSQLAPGSRKAREIVAAVNARIDRRYRIMSYNAFAKHVAGMPAPPIMIVDEVQNINNPHGAYYAAIHSYIVRHPDMRVVLLSGTPIFDSPRELVSLCALMRITVPTADSTGHYSA